MSRLTIEERLRAAIGGRAPAGRRRLCLGFAAFGGLSFSPSWAFASAWRSSGGGLSDGAVVAHAVYEAAARFELQPNLIAAIIQAESGGRPGAVSPKGAMGLMQLMPATWAALTHDLALGADPFEPRANVLAGSAYLRQMLDRFGAPGFLAAYNAGPGRYLRLLRSGAPLPAETVSYMRRVAALVGARSVEGPTGGRPADWKRSRLFIGPQTDQGEPAARDRRAPLGEIWP